MAAVLEQMRARYVRRKVSSGIDAAIIAAALFILSSLLPHRPPLDAMAFFSGQDFINYFFVAAAGIGLAYGYTRLALCTGPKVTFGMLLMRLKLVDLTSGKAPSSDAVRARSRRTAVVAALILIPGPLIALFIAFAASAVFGGAFTSADAALSNLGLSGTVRYGVHSLSFLVLAAALIWALGPSKSFERNGRLTPLDVKTQSVFLVKH